ncbi:DUF3829 domain-containing protein [Phreatobacter sp. HK31-P]
MRFAPSRSLSSSQLSRRSIALAFAGLPFVALPSARAVGAPAIGADLARARAKVGAYADLLALAGQMRTMWQRYSRLVNPERGPTGQETSINGLHAPRDLTRELAAAQAEAGRAPVLAECDPAMETVIRLHGDMARLVTEAAAYYASGQHKQDGGEKARDFHARLRKAVPAFIAACQDATAKLEPVREVVELAELAAFERSAGRDGRWHVRRATVEARKVMTVFPRAGGVIDLGRLDAALAAYEPIVVETEAFGAARPQAMIGFERSARNYLTAMRQARARIAAFPAEPKRWAPEIADVDVPFQGLLTFADAVLRNMG